MVKYSGSASSEATVLLIIYWVSMSELLLIVLTCEPTLLVVEYWSSPTLLAGRAISISMGLSPPLSRCYVLFSFLCSNKFEKPVTNFPLALRFFT